MITIGSLAMETDNDGLLRLMFVAKRGEETLVIGGDLGAVIHNAILHKNDKHEHEHVEVPAFIAEMEVTNETSRKYLKHVSEIPIY